MAQHDYTIDNQTGAGYQAYQVLASDLTQIALVGDGSSTFSAGGNINIMYE